MITVDPGAIGVKSPVPSIVPAAALLLLQVPPVVPSVYKVVAPRQANPAPVIAVTVGVVSTCMFCVAVMVALPVAT